jgi:hypothetical protein
MNPGLLILLVFFGSAVLVAIITVATMRFLVRKFGIAELMANDVRLTQNGIEYFGFLFTGIRKKTFNEIKSVELVSYYKVLISSLLFRYGISTRRIPPNFFSKIVVIRLKRPNPFEYLFFTPKDAVNFVEQLKQRINEA